MKAIILEVRDGYAAVLREDGLIVKTKQLGEVGTTVELSEKVVQFPSRGRRMMRTAVAAALALAVTGGAYTYTNVAEASYVTLDTEETSVELAVNRMGRVVKVRALDEDSATLAQELAADVRRMKVEDAVDAAMTRMDGAFTVVAGVTGENEKRSADLQEAVERGAERRERGDMELVTLEISRDERREAGARDMSAGRWAFERGGGRWHERAEREDAPTDVSEAEETDEPDAPDVPERVDHPAFAPEQGAEPPLDDAQPPRNGESGKGPQQPEGREDWDESKPDEQDDADRDEDDRPAPPEDGNRPQPPEQRNAQQPPENEQPPENAQPPQGDMTQPPDGMEQPPEGEPRDSDTQPPQSGDMQPPENNDLQTPMDGGPPRGDGPMAFAPRGDMQPAPQGVMPGGGGAWR